MFDIDKSIKRMIGNKIHGGKNDWDFDGVPNKKDCQPRNTMRQDISGWMNRNAEELQFHSKYGKLEPLEQMKARTMMVITGLKKQLRYAKDDTERGKLRRSIKEYQNILQGIK